MQRHVAFLTTVILGGLITLPAVAAAAAEREKPLRPVAKCLDISRVTQQYAPDDRTVIARTGPRFFRIDLKGTCPRLGIGSGVRFESSRTPDTRGYLCGDATEQIITNDGMPCSVVRVTPIDAKRFKELENQAIGGK